MAACHSELGDSVIAARYSRHRGLCMVDGEVEMRTLSANLLAEQVKTAYSPYTKIYLPDYSGGTDLSAYTKDVLTTEQSFGGSGYITLADINSWYISNGAPIDFKGYKVEVEWGATISGSPDTSKQAPLWIWDDPLTDFEGEVAVQFECIDIWQWLQMFKVMNASPAVGAPRWPGDTTIYDIIDSLLTNLMTLTLDSTDGIVDVYMPYYVTSTGDSIAKIIATLIHYTNCYIRAEGDGQMHIGKMPETSDSKYTFDISSPGHLWLSSIKEDAIVMPNRVIAVDLVPTVDPDDGSSVNSQTYEGSATDERSKVLVQRAFAGHSGYITRILEDDNLSSNSEATQLAEAALSAAQRSTSRGVLRAPMECSIELYDWVEVVTSRWP